MKRMFAFTGLAATMLLAFSLTAFADTWTDWISDSGCAAKVASAATRTAPSNA